MALALLSFPTKQGGFLGLFDSDKYNSKAHTVAVEFDTFVNQEWDPEGRHIGIDVNSIESMKTTPWELVNGENAEVQITYESSTKLLVASLVYPSQPTNYIVSQRVELESLLPEWVSVGFSATSGFSWSFSSKISDDDTTCEGLNLANIVLNNL